jgi:lipopolysaccharide export system protein LptA
MKYLFTYTPFLSLLILSSLAFPVDKTLAQSRVEILNADRAVGGVVEGESIRRLLGNVRLSTERMLMDADSVHQFVDQNLLHAYNIQIETEKEMIWADTLYHNTRTDYSQLRGRVIVQSETNTVFSDAIDAAMTLDLIIFNVPVRFEDEDGVLLAETGLYYQDADSAVFRGNVQLADSTQYLEADSLFMNRQIDLYELFGQVYAEDFEEKVTFTGDYLFADSTGYRRLTGDDAWMMEISESEADTTHLIAKEIIITETDTTSRMDAYRDVRIWSTRFSAIADTAAYIDEEERFELRSNPRLWQKNIQLSGPYIEAHLEDEDIRFLASYPRPIAVQEDTLTGRLHQMAGDTLHAFFDNGVIERIKVFDNSEIIFHQRDEDDEPDGLIDLISAGPSTMYFLDGEFDFFRAERNVDGSYLPEDPQNIDRRLDNFTWDPELKPQRPLIQTPRLPEIPGERPFELPPRYIRYLENLEQEELSD